MKKWSLRPDPSALDAARHVLLVQGEMKHVIQIVKKFGAMCGRPLKAEHPGGFNFRIHLHGITPLGLEKVRKHLEEICPGGAVQPSEESKTPAALASPSPEPVRADAACEPPAALEPPPLPATPLPTPSGTARCRESSSPPLTALPAPAVFPAPQRAAFGPLWGLRLQPDPKLNFESLLVGAHNRFAHAAATSVAGSPGAMYNPLFVYGVPGVGKTHILHAIAAALDKDLGQGAVVFTTGAGLSGAVSSALAEGKIAEIDNLMAGAKAILIDDAHLLDISEKNQAALARIFQSFFARNLQVVLTSVYPPRALGAMEEALNISLARGWSVDMKLPAPAVQEEVIAAFVDRRGAPLSPEEIKKLYEVLGPRYCEFPRLVARWTALSQLCRAAGRAVSSDDIISDLMGPGARACQAELPAPADLDAVRGFAPPAAGPDAPQLAFFHPKGRDDMAAWTLSRFYRTAAAFGIACAYRHVLCEAYDAENPFGMPFKIGESCRRAGADAALVLGPAHETKIAARSGEFSHAVRHILESFGAALGWIPLTETAITRPFLAAHLDFMASPPL